MELRNLEDVLNSAKRYATYGRVSTKKQDLEGQKDNLEAFLKSKGIDDIVPFGDIKSAFKKPFNKREHFLELLKAAQNREIDAVVVKEETRLTRQPKEHQLLRKLFQDLEIPVIVADKGELYTADDLIKNIVVDGVSRYEAETIATRTHHAMQQLIRNGKWTGGKIPYGYRMVQDSEKRVLAFEPEPEKMKNVEFIFRSYQSGETLSGIAKVLQAKETEVDDNGKLLTWTVNKVKFILTNPFYTGNMVYNRKDRIGGKETFRDRKEWEWVKQDLIKHPPISLDTWEICWKRFESLKGKAPRYLKTSFYFSGLLHCSCGRLMQVKNQRTKAKEGKHYGSLWYVCRDCSIKIKAEELHHTFGRYWDSLWLKSVEVTKELKQKVLLEIDFLEERFKTILLRLENWSKEKYQFQSALDHIKIEEVQFKDEKHFNSSALSLLIGLDLIRDEVLEAELEKGYLEKKIKRLKALVKDNALWEKFVRKLWNQKFENLTGPAKRSMVLLLVKDCRLKDHKQIAFVFDWMPEKSFGYTYESYGVK